MTVDLKIKNVWIKAEAEGLPEGGGLGYLVYTALLIQNGTDAPVATVLENTIGEVAWSRLGVGAYKVSGEGLFLETKTVVYISGFDASANQLFSTYKSIGDDNDIIVITGTLDVVNGYVQSDSRLSNGGSVTSIEIRVYPSEA